jgi:hypothetical protein
VDISILQPGLQPGASACVHGDSSGVGYATCWEAAIAVQGPQLVLHTRELEPKAAALPHQCWTPGAVNSSHCRSSEQQHVLREAAWRQQILLQAAAAGANAAHLGDVNSSWQANTACNC